MSTEDAVRLLAPLVLCTGVARLLSGDEGFDGAWYRDLRQPPLRPPSWVFGPVWLVLYLLLGAALVRFQEDDEGTRLLALHLVFNALWVPIFVHRHFWWAAVDLALMLLTLAAVAAHADSVTRQLLAPYGLWIAYASYLSVYIARAN